MRSTSNSYSPGERDNARLDALTEALQDMLPALERFLEFQAPETTGASAEIWSRQLVKPLPAHGAGAEQVLEELNSIVIPNGLRVGHPGFSGWVATMPTTVAAATHLASAVAGGMCVGIQAFNTLEEVALRWLAELLGLPARARGLFTSGGSVANLIALGAARQCAGEKLGVDSSMDGLSSMPEPRIYATPAVHHCIHRAAGVLGFGRRAVVDVQTTSDGSMDVGALRQQVNADIAEGRTPVAVVASAGTISTGAIDPMPELQRFCQDNDLWLHIDGAYGLLGVLDPTVAHLFGDLASVDSMVVDPQKWLGTSMGCGAVFVRDPLILERAFALEPAVYIEGSQPVAAQDGATTNVTSQFDGFGFMYHNLGIEHTLPSRGVEVWAVLKEIGVDGVRARVSRHIRYARALAKRVQESELLELKAPVVLSTCCFRYAPQDLRTPREASNRAELLNDLNREILRSVRARGRCVPSATTVDGDFVIRACFVNPRTTMYDALLLADEVEQCGSQLWAEMRVQARHNWALEPNR